MQQINPAFTERLYSMINSSPYPVLLSMTVREIEIGRCTFEINIDEKKHWQPYGIVHGGVIASLIDTATFWSVYLNLEGESTGLVNVDLKLNYLAPVVTGKLVVIGEQIRLGKTLGLAEARVTDERGTLIACGLSTLMVIPGKNLKSDSPMPSKFINV